MWHKYRVYIHIHALQFSLLGGRIFFKGLHYHGHNETIFIHDGFITWRYWLRRVRLVECKEFAHGNQQHSLFRGVNRASDDSTKAAGPAGPDSVKLTQNLPCRILLKARGVEWFIYNRSPAYDAILQSMSYDDLPAKSESDTGSPGIKPRPNLLIANTSRIYGFVKNGISKGKRVFGTLGGVKIQGNSGAGSSESSECSSETSIPTSNQKSPSLPRILQALPIKIECHKGAVVMGNQSTRSILIAKFEDLAGFLNARDSQSLDRYKQLIELEFTHPIVQFKFNKGFREAQISSGAKHTSNEDRSTVFAAPPRMRLNIRLHLLSAFRSLRSLIPAFRLSTDSLAHENMKERNGHSHLKHDLNNPGDSRWLGLSRYLDDDDDDLVELERWKAIEYGQYPTIVKSPKIAISYYWDIPGLVLPTKDGTSQLGSSMKNINGSKPPDWGLEIRILGGNIRYGPWADRQRADLQAAFFPNFHKDAIPTPDLKPGHSRMSTDFKLIVIFEEQTTLGISTREQSKDWKWKGRESAVIEKDIKYKNKRDFIKKKKNKVSTPAEVRPFGWIDMKILPDSSLNFSVDLVAGTTGYRNLVNLDLRQPEITTSVNHGLLWRSQNQSISLDLSNPLKWAGLHTWQIDVQSTGPEVFMLRDHIFLFSDIVNDWTSGPAVDFYNFVPFEYVVNLRLEGIVLHLNANDFNIINNPSDVDDNALITLSAKEMLSSLTIPAKSFRPSRNLVTYSVEGNEVDLRLLTPSWNTYHTFLATDTIATIKKLILDGSYNYVTSTPSGLADALILNVHGVDPKVQLYGVLIRYFLKVKDNYFGDDIHFRTLEEFQIQMAQREKSDNNIIPNLHHNRLSNDLDVILEIKAENPYILLPAKLYSPVGSISLDMSSLGIDLRFTNYYMDFSLFSSSIAFAQANSDQDVQAASQGVQMFIESLEICGHRLFGLPPTEPTYVCNWWFELGPITGDCSCHFLQGLTQALQVFTFTYEDAENALTHPQFQVVHDVTFVRAIIKPLELWLRIDEAAFLFKMGEAKIDFDDLSRQLCSGCLNVVLPSLTLVIIDLEADMLEANIRNSSAEVQAYIETSITARMVKHETKTSQNWQLQQMHIQQHDARTNRVGWLIEGTEKVKIPTSSDNRSKLRTPTMPLSSMPEPVLVLENPQIDCLSTSSTKSRNSTTTNRFGRKASFLAVSSSRQDKAWRIGSKKPPSYSHLRDGHAKHDHRALRTDDRLPEIHRSRSRIYVSPEPEAGSYVGKNYQGAQIQLTSASSYKRPHFPIFNIKLDMSCVREYMDSIKVHEHGSNLKFNKSRTFQNLDQANEEPSTVLHLQSKIRAFLRPSATSSISELMKKLQRKDPSALLDSLEIKTMTEVIRSTQSQKTTRETFQLHAIIPLVNLRLRNNSLNESTSATLQHDYDFNIAGVNVGARCSGKLAGCSGQLSKHHLAFSLFMRKFDCSAKEVEDVSKVESANIKLFIDNISLRILVHSSLTIDLRVHSFDTVSFNERSSAVNSLVQHSIILAKKFKGDLTLLGEQDTSRARFLVFYLISNQGDIPDPPFLAQASYVLRGTTNHLRTYDSWKMISQLRNIYQSLTSHLLTHLHTVCIQDKLVCPYDTQNHVITSFHNWRSWDLAHVRQSYLMRKVYGSSIAKSDKDYEQNIPFKAILYLERMRFLLDPGPYMNEIVLDRLIIAIASGQSHSRPSEVITPDLKSESFTVHGQCFKTTFHLNWELCEYLSTVFELLNQLHSRSSNVENNQRLIRKSKPIQCLHVILLSELVELKVNTINLVTLFLCHDLKFSLIDNPAVDRSKQKENILISFHAVENELRHQSQPVLVSRMYQSSGLYTSYCCDEPRANQGSQLIFSFYEITLEILEEPSALVRLAHLLLQDEVAHITRIMKNLEKAKGRRSSPILTHEVPVEMSVSVSLGSYLMSFALLPHLTYAISGKSARSIMLPIQSQEASFTVDFDVKENSHVFSKHSEDHSEVISALQLPPIYGYFGVDGKSDERLITFCTTIEIIVLEASSIHALLNSLNRPEIIGLIRNVTYEIGILNQLWQQDFSSLWDSQGPSLDQSPLLFNSNVSLFGLVIRTHAQRPVQTSESAQLQINLGHIGLKASNKSISSKQKMMLSGFELSLRRAEAEISRYDKLELHQCGNINFTFFLAMTLKTDDTDTLVPSYQLRSNGLAINLFPETASLVLDIFAQLQASLKTIDLPKEVKSLRRLTYARLRSETPVPEVKHGEDEMENATSSSVFLDAAYSLEVLQICIRWNIGKSVPKSPYREVEDLTLSFAKIGFSTRKASSARLLIADFQLQMVPQSKVPIERTVNSAILPQVVFNVAYLSTRTDRRLAFQAIGKSLDLRLGSHFILPANDLRRSIAVAIEDVRKTTRTWNASNTQENKPEKKLIGSKRLTSLLIDADFAGAVVYIQGDAAPDPHTLALNVLRSGQSHRHDHNSQFTHKGASSNTTLRTPGLALKVEYKNSGVDESSLNAEFKIDASSNIIYPTIVPLIREISSSVKEIVGESDSRAQVDEQETAAPRFLGDEIIRGAYPNSVFGRSRLNVGLRICKQEFSLSCQPIARVTATARFESIYLVVNTVQSVDYGKFFTLSASFSDLNASVQHVYSRDSTALLQVDSVVLSLMNSKHFSADNGLSAILQINPVKAQINAKQVHEFLLFREIWLPSGQRSFPQSSSRSVSSESQAFMVQHYQQVAAAGVFPWNAVVSIVELNVQLELGQSLGRSELKISDLWVSSKKASDSEQNLCLGFEGAEVNCTGRMSGYIDLQRSRVRTSINWPVLADAKSKVPLIQASLGFNHLRIKAAFDFQAFFVTDITTFDFLMYNVRTDQGACRDRLVGVLDGANIQTFCTTSSASQALALFQTIERLMQEKQSAYEESLKEIEKYLRRKSSINPSAIRPVTRTDEQQADDRPSKAPLRLATRVVVSLKAVNVGVFPSTFFDNQIFKAEALNAAARFAVVLEDGKLHSTLSMKLGQLRIALSAVSKPNVPKMLGEIVVDDIINAIAESRGGTILRVPKLTATMQTWQTPESTHIEYIFASSFHGKVDVGWNYSRISFLRGMWNAHTRALAQRLGKALPQSALQITTGLEEATDAESSSSGSERQKITAVVNVPQSRFEYTALQPPVIETPQLRDMGEATPPLEWIGLHRERLPNLTHQIVIVSLLEVAKEVEDAYRRILGSS